MPAADETPNPPTSVWDRPRPRPREVLTREQIVAEAVRLLDEDGIDALSMRKLGNRLNAAATSLYRHVANKDELIQLVVDDVYGELEAPAADGPQWRTALTRAATELRAMVLRHPWIVAELGGVGLVHIGPNVLRMSSALLTQFEEAGFPADEMDHAVGTLTSYVTGFATSEAAYLSLVARSGRSEQEWVAGLRPAFDEASREHPLLRAVGSPSQDADPRRLRDEKFTYGLDRVLDGLAARLPGGAS